MKLKKKKNGMVSYYNLNIVNCIVLYRGLDVLLHLWFFMNNLLPNVHQNSITIVMLPTSTL